MCTNLTNKQTEKVQSSPSRLLTSRPLGADREPARAGKLHLQGQGTEEVSSSGDSEPPTAPSTSKASTMDYSTKALIRDSNGSKVFGMDNAAKALIRDSDGSNVFAMDDFANALIRDSDRSKVFTIDAPDDSARKAPALDWDEALGAPGSATTATTLTGVNLYSDHLVCN